MCKKEFLNDYKIDWKYGDSNHELLLNVYKRTKSIITLDLIMIIQIFQHLMMGYIHIIMMVKNLVHI